MMTPFVQFVGAFAAGNVRAASEFLATEATPLPQEYVPVFEAIRAVKPDTGERLLAIAAKPNSPTTPTDLSENFHRVWLSPTYVKAAKMLLVKSGGPTAAFFDTPAHVVERARRTLCGALGTDADAPSTDADSVENVILEKMARFDRLKRQHEKVLPRGENPNLYLRNRGPLAAWFKGQEEEITRSLLPLVPGVIEVLIRFVNGGTLLGVYAGEFVFLLAQRNPLVLDELTASFREIYNEKPPDLLTHSLCNLLARLRDVDPWRCLMVLDRLYRKYPEDASLIDNLHKENFVQVETLNIQPRGGRNHLLIAAVSDLHHSPCNARDVEKVAARVREIDPDILIIAGDVANAHEYFSRALDLFRGAWRTLVVAGNHDVWSADEEGGPTSEELWEEVLPRLTHEAGAIWLEGNPVLVGGLAIVGSVGWYDYSGDRTGRSQEELADQKGRHVQDASRINWSWNDQEFAMTRRHRLSAVLSVVSARPEVKQILVVTHMPPFSELISEVEREEEHRKFFDVRSAYYFTPTLGEVIASFPKVYATVSGHTHQGQAALIRREGMSPIRARVIAESLPDDSLNEIVVYKI